MGKALAKQITGMSWTAKISLVLLCTLLTSVFMYEGWYKPRFTEAATVTYGVTVPSTASVGIDGSANLSATGTTTTAPTVRGTLSTTLTTSASSYRPTTGMTSGTAVVLMKLYSPVYAAATNITAPSGSFAIRGYNTSDTWTFHIYSYNPAGTAGNKTLIYQSTTTTSGTGATVTVTPTYTAQANTTIPAGYRLLCEIGYTPGGATLTPRVYLDGTTSAALSQLTVTETAVAAPTITSISPTSMTQGVTNQTLTINGTNLTGGAVSITSTGVTFGAAVISATQITVPVTVASTATTGARTLTVTTAGGSATSTFTVNAATPAPTITTVSPTSIVQGVATPVTITGTNLTGGTPNFSNASATGVTATATSITATVTGTTANAGTVSVTTAGGTSNTVAFTVTAATPAPTITTVSPASVVQGVATSVTITGTNLTGGTPNFSNASATGVTASATSITATVTGTTANAGTVRVTTSGGTSNTIAFTVTASAACTRTAPTITLAGAGTVAPGGQVAYPLTVTNNDTATCSASTFALAVGTETGVPNTTSFTVPSVLGAATTGALASGGAYTTTVTVKATATAVLGNALTSPVTATDTIPANHAAVAKSVVTTIAIPASPLLHSSANPNIGTKYGTWGTTYTCTTCHNQSTTNIKRVAASITTPTGVRSVLFDRITATTVAQLGVMGNDQRSNLNVSSNVCEACHHNTLYHQYSSVKATVTKTHNNRSDCTVCHNHAVGFAAAGCDGCHPATGGLVTTLATGATGSAVGAHAKHTGAPYNMTCYTCHNGYTPNPMGNTQLEMSFQVNATNFSQFNPAASVAFGTISGKTPLSNGYTWVGKNGTVVAVSANTNTSCNVYCHGNWPTARTTPDPNWSGGALACNSCHFDKTSAPAGAGDHQIHLGLTGTLNLTCAACHPSSGYSNGHQSGSVNWALSGAWFNANSKYNGALSGVKANLAPSSTYASCATTSCHGQNSPVAWGTTLTASGQCVKCHGQRTVTPYTLTNYTAAYIAPGGAGTDTGGNSAATAARVGAHQTHLTAVDGISDRVHCSECHTVITNVAAATHLTYTTATITFGNLAKTSSHTPSVTRTSGLISCSNTYCHTGKFNSGTGMTPSWVNANYLPTTMTIAGCSNCHGFPPSTAVGHPAATAPTGFPVGSNCNCHANISTTGTTYATIFVNRNLHINGIIEVDSGHSFPYPGATHLSAAGATTPATSPCATCHNVTAAGTYPVAAGTAPNCRACHTLGLVQSGTTTSCYDCHGSSTAGNVYANYSGLPSGNVFPNYSGRHATHVVKAGIHCATCHATGGTGKTTHGSSNRVASTGISFVHVTSTTAKPFHYTPPTTVGTSRGTCNNNACHGGANQDWNGTLRCIDCHSATIVRAKGRPGTTLAAVTAEFGLAWGHKKTGRAAVADDDCIVCHLEGNATTHKTSTFHGDGNIDLRDPDGAGETPITNMSGAAWTFQRYSTSFAAASRTATGHTANTINNIITQKFCLKCHDANGASNPTARSNNGGTGTQYNPWGGVNLGTNYTTTNGAASAGGVINVFRQFSSGNSSRHPVRAPNSRAYPYSTRLGAPYNNIGTTRDANTTAANTASPRVKANSVVLYCDDCHNLAAPRTLRTVTAHGSATEFRGTYYVGSPTLCTTCHIANTTATSGYLTSSQHGSGSAFTTGNNNIGSNTLTCHNCHFSSFATAAPARPILSADIHGFNGLLSTGGAWTYGNGNGMRPIALIRNVTRWTTTSPRPYVATGITAGQSNCGGSASLGTGCSNQNHSNYSPGGSY